MENTIEEKIEYTVSIIEALDDNPDVGWMEGDPESADRIAAYKRGEFYFIGVKVLVERYGCISGNSQTYESGGVWGVESDSPESHLQKLARDEMSRLIDDYPQLAGVLLDNALILSEAY